ncbi:MAG: MmgE/PrpD family protein [Vicinamibacterales bacterium]|nr:MmgE/PrpD family protein [Vicinamibacterales bacterium]
MTRFTRRDMLRTAGCTLAAAAMPRAGVFAQPPGPVMVTLSNYMAAAAERPLPPDVVEHVKLHVLDTFAAMISGTELAPGQAALRFAKASGGRDTATVVGSRLLAGPIDAALANGVLAHSDETDDSHGESQSHPGAGVVSAALAAGEQFGISGTRFMRAVALGYDVGTRVTIAMGGSDFRYESHKSTHAIAGAFGAAAAAASAAGLTAQQMRWVFDYTAQQSSGIGSWGRDADHIEKGFVFGGMPARTGVTSTLLVQLGWNGVDDVFSGDDNFFLAYAPKAKPELLVEGLGSRYEVARTDIKKWTVGTPIQAPLDAVELARQKHPFEVDQVKGVVVRLAPDVAAVVDNRDIPDICLQHMVTVMLIDKTASFKAAHDKPRMKDAEVLRQRSKVQLIKDESLVPYLPARVAIVEITLTDGTRLSERVDAVRGTVRNPMTRQEVADKARDLMTPVLGAGQTGQLIEAVFNLERLASVRALRPLLQRA